MSSRINGKRLALKGFDVESRNLDAWLTLFQKSVKLHRTNLNNCDADTLTDSLASVGAHVAIPAVVVTCIAVRFCATLVTRIERTMLGANTGGEMDGVSEGGH